MKLDKLNLDGNKGPIEVLDKIFLAKVNPKLVNNVFSEDILQKLKDIET